MAITKTKKIALITDLDEKLQGAQSIVFVQFKKLSVADTIKLRRKLRAQGVGYTVMKKTLLKRVLDTKNITGEMPDMPKEIAVAYATDLLAPSREVYAFSKEFKDAVSIDGGVFEGKYMSQSEMLSIATIPSQHVLYTQLVGLLVSPIRSFAVALDQIAIQKEA